MPTDIERNYVERGYRLPRGQTWEAVEASRRKWHIDRIMVPLAVAPGCVGWGQPFIDGKPLQHP